MQLVDDRVVLREILVAAASVDDARQSESIQFAHEVPRRIHLMLGRKLWTFRERRVKNRGVRSRDEQSGGIALMVALDFTARRIGTVLRITARAQRCLIQ